MRIRSRTQAQTAPTLEEDASGVLRGELVDYSSPKLLAGLLVKLNMGVVETPLLLLRAIELGYLPSNLVTVTFVDTEQDQRPTAEHQ